MLKKKSRGQTFVENCIIWGLVCVVAIGILTTFGGTIKDIFFKSKEQVRGFQPFGVPTEASDDHKTGDPNDSGLGSDSDGPGDPGDVILIDPLGTNSVTNDSDVNDSDVNDSDANSMGLNVDVNEFGTLPGPGDPGDDGYASETP